MSPPPDLAPQRPPADVAVRRSPVGWVATQPTAYRLKVRRHTMSALSVRKPSRSEEAAIVDVLGRLCEHFHQWRDCKDHELTASDKLVQKCNELLALIDTDGGDEEKLHQWLNRSEHHIFLDPHPTSVRSKVPLINDITDFVIRRSDNTYLLVEIERANLRIFTKSKAEPTSDFNHACTQVRDWQRFIKDNVHTVRNEIGLTDIYDPRGMVVMGRSSDINDPDARVRWLSMKNTYDLQVYTYDEICDRVRAIAANLRNLFHSR